MLTENMPKGSNITSQLFTQKELENVSRDMSELRIIAKAIEATGLRKYANESEFSFFSGKHHQGRAKFLLVELEKDHLSLKDKQALLIDNLSKFDNNVKSIQNKPYADCPAALTKKFNKADENEKYGVILAGLYVSLSLIRLSSFLNNNSSNKDNDMTCKRSCNSQGMRASV